MLTYTNSKFLYVNLMAACYFRFLLYVLCLMDYIKYEYFGAFHEYSFLVSTE